MRITTVAACAVFVARFLVGSVALADVSDAERVRTAAEEFDAGRRSFKVRDFPGAAVHFENADRDAPSVEALLAAIRSRYEAKQLARAATLAASGVVRYPQEKPLVDLSRRVISEAEKTLHKMSVQCSPECALVLDDKVVPVFESTRVTLFVDPGAHSLVAGWPGDRRLVREWVAVPSGASELVLVAPAESSARTGEAAAASTAASPSAASPAGNRSARSFSAQPPAGALGGEARDDAIASRDDGPRAARANRLSPLYFYGAAGATVLLAGITTWSGVDTLQNPGPDAVREACRSGSSQCQTLYDQGVAHQRRTNYLLAGTAGLAVATAVLGVFFTRWTGRTESVGRSLSLTPVVGVQDGWSVGAMGRF